MTPGPGRLPIATLSAQSLTEPPAVVGRSAVATVVAELERIVFEESEIGARLPSEGEIARSLTVSRLTVREAIRNLHARGLVDISQGRRAVVAAPNSVPVGDFFETAVRRDPRSLLELLEIRQALEVHIAGVAAVRATRANIDLLEAAVAAMRASVDQAERFHDADMQFHEALAGATGNRLLSMLLESLAAPLRISRRRSYGGHLERRLPVSMAIDEHEAILIAVRGGDARAAAAGMRRHLRETERDLVAALRHSF